MALKDDLEEIKSAKESIKSTLNANGANVGNDITTYSTGVEAVASVKKVNNISADSNKNVTIDASNINVDETAQTKTTIKSKLETIDTAIGNIAEYTIAETTTTSGYSKTYSLKKDNVEIGTKINIPKDLVVKSGEVKAVTTANTPYTGAKVNDKYIDLELNDSTQNHIYIPVNDLVDAYTGVNGTKINVSIDGTNQISATIKAGTIELTDLVSTLQTKLNNVSTASNILNGSAEGSLRTINSEAENNSYKLGQYAFAEGFLTTASGNCSHAEGGGYEDTTSDYKVSGPIASGRYSHAEGYHTISSGDSSHAEGSGDDVDPLVASGACSHAEGNTTTASGDYSHAEGDTTTASGDSSHAEGFNTEALVNYSHAEGYNTTASGSASHAEGKSTRASANCSHAEGNASQASGAYSHAEGYYTVAEGGGSHAEGSNTVAGGGYQHVQGKYNIKDTNKYAHIVGNGTADKSRSNAHTIDWEGNTWYQGKAKIGGTSYDDTSAKFLATEEYADNVINNYFADPSEVELPESHTGTYYFAKSNGIYSSNNQNKDSTSAESTFTVPNSLANTNFQIKWTVSSEGNYDKFTLKVGDDTKVNDVSGVQSGSIICNVASGTKIIATYTKDNSSSSGTDTATVQFLSLSNKNWLPTDVEPEEIYEPKYDGSPATKKYVDTKFGSISVPESFDGEVFGGWHMYSDGADLTNEAGFTDAMYEKIKVGNTLYYPSSVNSNESVETIITYVSSGYSYKSAGGRFWYKRFSTGAGYTYEVSNDALFTGHIYKGTSADDNSSGGGGVACFTADTLISTPTELKKISDIKVGDKVYSYNDKKKVIEEKKVDKLVNHLTDEIYKITVGNEVIETTFSHPFFVLEKGKCIAENLEVGDTLRTLDNRLVQITNIEIVEQKDTTVYEIRIKGNNNYYVGEQNSVLVYNEKSVIEDK